MDVPNYIQNAAGRGLDYYNSGYGGSPTEQTLNEARALARGEASDDKIIRANVWASMHANDLLVAQNNNPNHPNYPGPGAVAHMLWGISPLNADLARDFYRRTARRIQQARAIEVSLKELG